jgi:hypothetical protein
VYSFLSYHLTIIKYTIQSSLNRSKGGTSVALKIFEVIGNEVATLVDEYRSAGNYEVEFDPTSSIKHLASGVFFYQLKVGSFVKTRKMILLR